MSHVSPQIETDIEAYLEAHERKDLLRGVTTLHEINKVTFVEVA